MSQNMTPKQASEKISNNVQQILELIDEARDLANKHGIPFDLSSAGLVTEQEAQRREQEAGWDSSNC